MSEKASSLIRDRVGCIDGWYRTEGGEMRSQLMDAADAVEVIESENAMLRMQLADVTESMGRVEDRCAKLRELAADMLKAMRHMEESAGMDVMVGHSPWFAPKLRELGVEVE